MKETELMLGDYVRLSPTAPYYKMFGDKPFKISTLYGDGELVLSYKDGTTYWAVEEDLEPIPLTRDILLANGFIFEPKIGYISADGRINLDHRIPNYPRKWYAHIDNEDFQSIASCDLDYLHQLQHLLTICGIEKEWKL